MLALSAHRTEEESKRCHICGFPKEICRDRSTANHVAVEVERCHVAKAVMEKQTALANADPPADHPGSLHFLPQIPVGGLADLVPEAAK